MPKREDLEGMHWNVTSKPIESRGGSNTVFMIGDMNACIYDDWRQMDERGLSTEAVHARARLLAAAPALALACLDALATIRAGRWPEKAEEALEAALAAAGVAPGPEGGA